MLSKTPQLNTLSLLPSLLDAFAGSARTWVVALLQPFGKTQGDGRTVRGCLRYKDALLDTQAALGRMLVQHFTLGKEAFPDPCSAALKELVLFPGRSSNRSITYAGHNRAVTGLFNKLDIAIKKKKHAPRSYAARAGDAEGLADEVGSGHAERMHGHT